MIPIHFFNEEISFELNNQSTLSDWIEAVILSEGHTLIALNFIFCSDQYLLKMNQDYLGHDTLTDIITFDNSNDAESIEGDIFLSIERIKDNAHSIDTPFESELHRVMIHGVLHLMGYDDKNEADKKRMRKKEDACLSLLKI